jgi:hypothetical protein
LTKCGGLLEVEPEETETAVVAVNMVEAIETVAVTVTMVAMTVKAAATLKMATTVESAEMVVAVMTVAEKAAVDVTDGKDGGRQHIRENAGLQVAPSQQQDDWDERLPLGEFTHKNHVHASMQQTPFMIDTGVDTCTWVSSLISPD